MSRALAITHWVLIVAAGVSLLINIVINVDARDWTDAVAWAAAAAWWVAYVASEGGRRRATGLAYNRGFSDGMIAGLDLEDANQRDGCRTENR